MKKSRRLKPKNILTNIRIISLKSLIVPIIIIGLILGVLIAVDFDAIFKPTIYKNSFNAYSAYLKGTDTMVMELSKLKYTGYNIEKNDKVVSVYYYDLSSGKCMFYKLDMVYDSAEEIPPVLENVKISAKIVEPDGLSRNMMESFAGTINWHYQGLSEITFPVIVDEHQYNPGFFYAVYIVLIIGLFYCLFHIAYTIIIIIVPYLHPAYLRVKPYFPNMTYFEMIDYINDSYEKDVLVRAGYMCITDKLFINTGKRDVCIMPLEEIVLAYEHSELFSVFGMHMWIYHNLYLCGHKNIKVHASHKKATNMTIIKDYLKVAYPDIMWGHTKHTVKAYKQIVAMDKKVKKEKSVG